MKKIFIGILIFFVATLILYISLFAFINTRGKDILAKRVEAEFGAKPEISEVSLRFPFTLEISDFQLGDLFFAHSKIYLRGFNPFNQSLLLGKVYLDRLEVKVTRKNKQFKIDPIYRQKPFLLNNPSGEKENIKERLYPEEKAAEKKLAGRRALSVEINHFYLTNSTIRYIDKSEEKKVELALPDMNAEIKGLHYPDFTKCFIDFSSSLEVKGKVLKEMIKAEGWVDYYHRSMDIDLKTDLFSYDIFSELYPPFWQAENLGVEEAFLTLASSFKAKDNDLTIDISIVLESVDFMDIDKEDQAKLSRQRLVRTVINLLKRDDQRSGVRFKIKTQMDNPQITPASLGKSLKSSFPIDSRLITGHVVDRAVGTIREGAERTIRIPKNQINKTIDTLKDTLESFKNIFIETD